MIILVDFESCSYEIVNLIPSVMLNALKYGIQGIYYDRNY